MSSPFDLLIPKVPESRESWFWATVTAVGPLRLTRDGDTAAMPYIPEALVPVSSLSVGHRVRCQLYNRTLFIIGAAGGVGQGEEASQTNNWDTTIESGIYYSVAYNSGGPVPSFKYTGVVVNASLGFVTQVLTTADTDNPEVFSRASSSYGNTWGDWQQITLTTGTYNNSGLSFSMGSEFTMDYYWVRFKSDSIQCHFRVVYTGSTATVPASGNFGDKIMFTAPSSMQTSSGVADAVAGAWNIDVYQPGVTQYFGRISGVPSNFLMTHGIPGTTLSNGADIHVNAIYPID